MPRGKKLSSLLKLAELADEIIFFCEKTTVLAEKVFHPAASEAQLTAPCHMLSLFYQTDWYLVHSFSNYQEESLVARGQNIPVLSLRFETRFMSVDPRKASLSWRSSTYQTIFNISERFQIYLTRTSMNVLGKTQKMKRHLQDQGLTFPTSVDQGEIINRQSKSYLF